MIPTSPTVPTKPCVSSTQFAQMPPHLWTPPIGCAPLGGPCLSHCCHLEGVGRTQMHARALLCFCRHPQSRIPSVFDLAPSLLVSLLAFCLLPRPRVSSTSALFLSPGGPPYGKCPQRTPCSSGLKESPCAVWVQLTELR